jgi:hypothetical protein
VGAVPLGAPGYVGSVLDGDVLVPEGEEYAAFADGSAEADD